MRSEFPGPRDGTGHVREPMLAAPIQRRSRLTRFLFLSLSLGGLAAGVFVMPFFVPQPGALLSVSTLAGYNNSVAYPLYVLFLGLSVFLIAGNATSEQAAAVVPSPPSFLPSPPVLLVLALHILLFGGLYAVKRSFVFAEALYFQDLLYRMEAGAIPFVDVHFFYGPALLYPPFLLSRLLGIELAYALYYVASYLVGLCLLYVTLSALVPSRRTAEAWFVLFAVGFFNPYAGLNYDILRHALPLAALLSAWWCFTAPSIGRLAGAVALVTLAMGYSPEIGLVTLLSVATLSALTLLRPGDGRVLPASPLIHLAVPLASVAVLLLMFHLIDPSHRALIAYFQPIVTFSSGGWNTPVDPSAPTLAMMGLSLMVGVVMLKTVRSRGWDETAAWLGSCGVLTLLMERAAFGKADIMHLAYSGLPLYMLAVGFVSRSLRGAIKGSALAVIIGAGLVLPLQLCHAMMFLPHLLRSAAPIQAAAAGHQAERNQGAKDAIQASLARAVEHFGRERPYYMHKLEYYRLPIYLRFKLEPILYFPSLTSAFTEADIRRVIEELRARRAIILARRDDLGASIPKGRPSFDWLLFLTSSPLPGSTVHDLTSRFQARLEAPLVEFLRCDYDIGFEDGEIVALLPR